jgi:hypothetical protein
MPKIAPMSPSRGERITPSATARAASFSIEYTRRRSTQGASMLDCLVTPASA